MFVRVLPVVALTAVAAEAKFVVPVRATREEGAGSAVRAERA